jgi:hypothetical protein
MAMARDPIPPKSPVLAAIGRTNKAHHAVSPAIGAIIERCRASGLPKDRIAKIVGMSAATLDKYYDDDYAVGNTSLVGQIAGVMGDIALDPGHKQCVAAGKFMLSRLAPDAFSERSEHKLLDANNNAIGIATTTLSPYDMTEEQREALRSVMASVLIEAVEDVVVDQQSKIPQADYVQIEDQSNGDTM